MSTHTPGPWVIIDEFPLDFYQRIPGGFAYLGECVATAVKGEGEATAAYIIRACNAHEDLVRALELAVPELVAYYGKDHFAVNVCRQAIAKAEGRA